MKSLIRSWTTLAWSILIVDIVDMLTSKINGVITIPDRVEFKLHQFFLFLNLI